MQFSQHSPSVLVDPMMGKTECSQGLNCLWNLLLFLKNKLSKKNISLNDYFFLTDCLIFFFFFCKISRVKAIDEKDKRCKFHVNPTKNVLYRTNKNKANGQTDRRTDDVNHAIT